MQGVVKIQRDLGVVSSTFDFCDICTTAQLKGGPGRVYSLVLSWGGTPQEKQERRIPTNNTTSVAKLQATQHL